MGLVGSSAPHTPGPGTQVPAEWDGRNGTAGMGRPEWGGRNGSAGMGRPEWDGRNGTAGDGYPEGPHKNRKKERKKEHIKEEEEQNNCGFMCPERPGLSKMVQKS